MHYALDNKYPIETEAHVKIAVGYFDQHLQRFSPTERVKIATSLSRRIDSMGLEIDRPWVSNYSRAMEKTASFSPDFTQNVQRRVELAKTAKATLRVGNREVPVQAALESFLTKYAAGTVSPGEAIDFLSEIDKISNFEYHYDQRIKDPFLTVFGCDANPDFDMPKFAASCPDVDRRTAHRALKKKAVMTKLAAAFGDKFASDFALNPETIFNSMPAPERQLISDILRG